MPKKILPSIFDRRPEALSATPIQKELPPAANEPFRPLKPKEADLLRHLLETGGATTREFLPQLLGLQARRSCTCGCPSIALKVAENVPKVQTSSQVIVDDVFGYSEGKLVGLIVFAKDGELRELEAYDVAGQFTGEFSFPEISTLTSGYSATATQPSAE